MTEQPQEHETKARVQVPDAEMPEEVEATPKGKMKSLFRKLETSLINEIDRRLNGVNGQIGKIHDQLDKKFGGMYKVLIHQFLTKQETKIYNAEIAVEASRRILANFLYSEAKTTETFEEWKVGFDKEFEEVAIQIDKEIKAKEAEANQDGEVSKEQEGEETTAEGQDNNG